ncbi:hypothetical protein VTJ04DRAFT_7968 [Mycothermus thermophilus]|uniref:uncharacterized protein n=1 Tax=Humicola insolens TaxID=85995 RepID=UPI00374206FD
MSLALLGPLEPMNYQVQARNSPRAASRQDMHACMPRWRQAKESHGSSTDHSAPGTLRVCALVLLRWALRKPCGAGGVHISSAALTLSLSPCFCPSKAFSNHVPERTGRKDPKHLKKCPPSIPVLRWAISVSIICAAARNLTRQCCNTTLNEESSASW